MSKVLLITGGGRGIGAATARLAAAEGYALCLNYQHNKEAAEALAAELRGQTPVITVQADVALGPDVLRLFETVDRELGRLTALVNNAGIVEMQSRLEDMTAERLQRVRAF